MERFNQVLVDVVRLIDNRPLSEIEVEDLDALSYDFDTMVKMIDEEIANKERNHV